MPRAKLKATEAPNVCTMFVIFAALSAHASAQCKPCAREVTVLSNSAMRFVTAWKLPSPRSLRSGLEPIVFSVRVGLDGKVCAVQNIRPDGSASQDRLAVTIRDWRFRVPLAEGQPVCLITRVYIYVRRSGREMTIIVPGLTDSKHPARSD